MRSSLIKTCGLFREEDIDYANKLDADYIGFVFASGSKREVDDSLAYKLKRKLKNTIKAVGVFRDNSIDFITYLFNENIIDLVQLHGKEDNDFLDNLKSKINADIIKAISIKDEHSINHSFISDFILLDSSNAGSGNSFDWKFLKNKLDNDKNFKKEFNTKYFLAGGININNIKEALELNPYCIDLSSGLEVNGVKDFNKMKSIIDEVNIIKGAYNGK
ncbi:phosphoribosylanthranilate isomerase [Brachyspira murdochii]|uniref:phosphoribosylanthranilate isomerase n=1 Tax=Brachyspira murdochii TaxID=84378 RepID=UPI003005A07B